MRASAEAEKLGLPTVSLVSNGFEALARAVGRQLGMPGGRLATIGHVLLTKSDDEIRAAVRDQLADQVIAGLLAPPSTSVATVRPRAGTVDRTIQFTGSLEEVTEHFEQRLWTDGLPIVPPTLDRVDRFLAHTGRDAAEPIGVLQPSSCLATVWNVAVNGVMAGCRPEYMPVLLGIAEVLADKGFRLEDGGSTPGWEPLVIVSGPVRNRLDFNYGAGVMRIGRRANSSVGRFTRLFARNVAGLRIPPGDNDKGTIGMGLNVALAEDEQAAREVGWPTFAEERGFASDESVVTVQSILSVSPPIYTAGTRAEQHAQILAETIGQMWGFCCDVGLFFGEIHPLLVMSPSIARVIAGDGWSKDDLRDYLYRNVKVTAESIQRYAMSTSGIDVDFAALEAVGTIPPGYVDSDDPMRLVPGIPRKEHINIIVAGDGARNQSRGYVQNHRQGPPLSRRLADPAPGPLDRGRPE
jgi:hypothetical protein